MDEASIKKQREIGKRLFLVNIIHHENDKVRKGGYSFQSRDDLAAWASMTEDEIDHFVDVCSALDPYSMAVEAANGCRREDTFKSEKEAYLFLLSLYYRMGDLFASVLEIDKFEDNCRKFSEHNFQIYCENHREYPVSESYSTPKVFKEAMRFYINYLLAVIEEVLSEGYDWDVITSMTRDNITKDRYHSLVNAFVREDTDE